jgi:mRNA-degrading endonuclease RelE of RelBE toxin-antitoxin system
VVALTEAGAPYRLEYDLRAIKNLSKFPKSDAAAIVSALEALSTRGSGNVLPLKNHEAQYRLRVGHYRVFLDVLERTELVEVIKNGRKVKEKRSYRQLQVLGAERRTGNTY